MTEAEYLIELLGEAERAIADVRRRLKSPKLDDTLFDLHVMGTICTAFGTAWQSCFAAGMQLVCWSGAIESGREKADETLRLRALALGDQITAAWGDLRKMKGQ